MFFLKFRGGAAGAQAQRVGSLSERILRCWRAQDLQADAATTQTVSLPVRSLHALRSASEGCGTQDKSKFVGGRVARLADDRWTIRIVDCYPLEENDHSAGLERYGVCTWRGWRVANEDVQLRTEQLGIVLGVWLIFTEK